MDPREEGAGAPKLFRTSLMDLSGGNYLSFLAWKRL